MKRLMLAILAVLLLAGTVQNVHAYGVSISSPLNYSDAGWGGWSVPAGNVVLGGGFNLTGSTAVASAPAEPNSVWPHYTYGTGEYGWVVQSAQDGNSSPGSNVYATYDTMPTGYGVAVSPVMSFSDGGWGGWSVPQGKVVLGGGFIANNPVSASAPGTPNSIWAHYTYGANEYGWVIQDAVDGNNNAIQVYAIYADETAITGYEVMKSSALNYSDGGFAGWSVSSGKVVSGGGFLFAGDNGATPSVSAPGTPDSAWPHYTFGSDEYGWVVADLQDGITPGSGSYVYAIGYDSINAVPVPAAVWLLGSGLLGLLGIRRKMKN